ncbi:hypothetical protein GCM10007424_13230 [Flavobacterium suaedae]|uniref:Signal peptidase n=1 Tax=Flavobacterium suaedae TaxID=1767027 RepID=A0ABQ1JU68_9FLAO|nr:hypothetical protein [Flavobacterium suaedae]GGB74650.1 hypothetical protein GCM10007424_13230 [Flavobacterium suaedae]
MKNLLSKFYVFIFLLVSNYSLFAQGPNDEGDGDCLECVDPPASISKTLLILAIVGILFAFYYYSNKKQQKAVKN